MTGFVAYLTYCSFGVQLLFGPIGEYVSPYGFLNRVERNWEPRDARDLHIVYWPSPEYDRIKKLQHTGGCLAVHE